MRDFRIVQVRTDFSIGEPNKSLAVTHLPVGRIIVKESYNTAEHVTW
jgi:hypothetical protein